MEKKQLISVVKPLIAAALLFGSSGGVAWGQTYIGTDLNAAANVNNEFGAGESAVITGGSITYPHGHPLNGSPNTIWLGSSLSKNVVINSYNAGGYYQDWMYRGVAQSSQTATSGCPGSSYPGYHTPPADNAMTYTYTHLVGGSGTPPGSGITHAAITYGSCSVSDVPRTLWDGGHFSPYVRHILYPNQDNGVDLIQFAGATVNDDVSYTTAQGVPAKTQGNGLNPYVRPTMVAIGGKNTFQEFYIEDLKWWYRTFNVGYMAGFPDDTHYYSNVCYSRTNSPCSYSCPSPPPTTCWGTEYFSHTVKSAIHHKLRRVGWNQVTHESTTFLDAAIQIMAGANICLRAGVKDATSSPGSMGGGGTTNATDAMVIYPTLGNNFVLRMKGNYDRMQQKHAGNTTELYYEAANFPIAGDNDIFLAGGGSAVDWRGYKTSADNDYLTIYNGNQYNDITFPTTTTPGSILGIYGNYNTQNADIYTNSTSGETGNAKGVIEVGPGTSGQEKFHISSGGIYKNFSSQCDPDPCMAITMNSSTTTPNFKIAGTDPLYILNTGNCCNAKINMQNDGVTNLTSAVSSASGVGDVVIQAHGGSVNLLSDANFNAASKDNNISILSDESFISTKKFEHTAGTTGGAKGHLTLWAKGNAAPGCGGYIYIDGDLKTTSAGAASSWQGMLAALGAFADGVNVDKLARTGTGCALNEEIEARKTGSLNTKVQTRIQSDRDYIRVSGDFVHKGKEGGLFIQAARHVLFDKTAKIDFKASPGNGDAVVQSRNSYVTFGDAFTYEGHKTSDLFIDGETGVNFNKGTKIEYLQTTDAPNIGIQSNAGTISFAGADFTFDYKAKGKTQLWAGDSIISTQQAPLIFKYTKAASGQDIDWYAGKGIRLNGTLTFQHDDATDHTGFIKLRANTNEEKAWRRSLTALIELPGKNSDECPQPCGGSGTVGTIDLNNAVSIAYKGTEPVWFAAHYDVNVNHNYTHVAGSGQTNQGYTRFVAGHDITTGKGNETTTAFNYIHQGSTEGNFDMKAGNDIITHNKANIGYSSATDGRYTTLFACRNIDIRNAFSYGDSATSGTNKFTRLFAKQDILSNNTCLSYGAPINFYTPDNTTTDWNASRNIITGDSVNFRYGSTTNQVKDLYLVAQGGNIIMKRWTNINYDSDNRILISAERNKPYSKARAANRTATGGDVANTGASESPRFLPNGQIYTNDSMNITRNNLHAGTTDIYADYHIRTAMMNITNTEATNENKTTIESHKGDIWLGYGVLPYVCATPGQTDIGYDKNLFHYKDAANTNTQSLKIRAGYQDQANTGRYGGGNIYIAQMKGETTINGTTNTDITIPFSNEYFCGSAWSGGLLHNRRVDTMMMYEHAGIIFGLGHCGKDKDIDSYAPGIPKLDKDPYITKRSLTYLGNKGNLTVDAGTRGNIIINRGAYLNFQDPSSTGNATFRTRFGDIDMREPFNVDSMVGSLLFLAQIDNISDLSKVKFCGCEEERNNVYLQDFQYRARAASGSVFIGADNNIKLNYGGLQNIGTRHDPFLSKDYTPCPDGGQQKIGYGYNGTTCADDLHCDAVSSENKARTFLMKFDKDTADNPITSGGFAAVASDYIDVYKKFAYYGGSGSGLSSVPTTGTLHGETVSGYGLFMKTQANKGNWNINIFENTPTCPTPCSGTNCGQDYLHMVSRMTFHDDAYIEAHNQEVMLWSPVIETFGDMTLDTKTNAGSKTEITLKADSLIFHSDFVKKGNNVKLSTWSGLHKDLPIMKFGHMRKTPPFIEAKKSDCQTYTECVPCYRYIRFSKDPLHMLDTITIKFGDDAYMERLNTVVFDHTILTCLTDSFDHVKGGAVQNAQIRTDTFKIRNQVDLFADEKHERDAHLELISEEQMGSKDYAGIYTKHLHMEPIGACGTPYSELWTSDDLALDVITTSIFGGFGFIHSDVHVENGGHLNAGFTSLRLKGMCYEQMCGTQRMKDLRLDVGAQLHFSVGTSKGLNGEYSDAIEVDRLTTYGSVDVNIEIRPCEKIEKRCYPIIYYKSITPNSLNQLKLNPRKVKIDGEEYPLHLNLGTDGVVYVCVGDAQPVDINRTVTLPSVSGVKTDPGAGIWDVKSRGNFKFKATYSGSKPLAVRTNRTVNGVPELLTGTKNANGEYEYIVPNVQQDITLSIGPDYVSNQLLAGTAVWSHGEMIYIRVDRADIASIYSVAGQLVRKVDLPEGDTSIPMSRGAYVITLKDGSVHKVIVK